MTNFLGKANAMALIINELLCYMLAKIDSVPTDTLTRLVNENFSDNEVEIAKGLLCDHVDDSIKTGNKRGQNKKKHNLDDIVKMLVQCDRSTLPKFVALDLSKLPPISIDCIDVSSLMRKQQLQEVEMANLKVLVQEILTVTAETSKRVEVGLLCNPSVKGASCTASPSPNSTVEPALDDTVPVQAGASVPTYSEVVRDATANPDSKEWSIANRKKQAKAPTPRKPAVAPSTLSLSTAGTQQVRPAVNKAVIGSRKSGSIKAVAAVKRVSVFMSRLPPGTGEEAVKVYVMEQTGAEDVTAIKLKTKYDSYESYRLNIVNPSNENILDPDLWAQGLVVRRFFVKRQSPDSDRSATAATLPAL